jgi:EAL domain-containing protein (putative c-di-GMP-specific phosphodiesterase class I)/GGDEF domain-containing protein
MSLYKKLWLAVILLLTLVFTISVLVTTISARTYLEEQLSMKNADNASALALSLSEQGADEALLELILSGQFDVAKNYLDKKRNTKNTGDTAALAQTLSEQGPDAVLLELTLSAQFDTGFYELIELTNPAGQVTVRRFADDTPAGAPSWFIALLPIRVEPGIASIQAGWQQAGTLVLRSHSRFAYAELWQNTLMLTGTFLLAGIIAGLLGSSLLRRILLPLGDMVEQAEAIGNRRFITIPEPSTLEFKQVTGALNDLSSRIKTMLGQETKRLQKWQRDSHVDKITGLYNREPFLSALQAAIESNDDNSAGALCIIRLTNLGKLNQAYGRNATDDLLHAIGQAFNRIVMRHSGWAAARLNGSDFAIMAPRKLDAGELGQEMQEAMFGALDDHNMREGILLPGGATVYKLRDTVAELLNRTDGTLIAAEHERVSSIGVAHKGDIPIRPVREQVVYWRSVLEQALKTHSFSLAQFPAVDLENKLIHYEAPVRLQREDKVLSAGQFLPWVHRLQLSGELDKQVFELALDTIERTQEPTAINLSVAAITDESFKSWMEAHLNTRSALIPKLWIEIPESVVFRYLENFKRLSQRIKAHGGHVGIEHIGHQLAKLGELHDVGLDYLKVDASFVRDIQSNPGNQTLLRTLCTLGHTVGVRVIAEGVNTEDEWSALKEVGIDGATGPGISLPD